MSGLLVPPRDSAELANSILTLLRDTDRRRIMGEAGHRKVLGEFSWERIAERTIEVYENVLREARVAHRSELRRATAEACAVESPWRPA